VIAIIPAAGLGKRMASVTGGGAKELLPLGRKVVLERIIDEAIYAGVDEVIVVSSPAKPEIEEAVNEWSKGRLREARIRVVYQTEPRGWADAVFLPRVESDILVMLGDCVYRGDSPCERMVNLISRGIDGCIAVEEVPESEVNKYGICEVNDFGNIGRIIEKPAPGVTSSRWASAARYAFSAPLVMHMEQLYMDMAAPDLPLPPVMAAAIANGFTLKAVALQPDQERVDCGTPEEYSDARRLPWD